MKRPPLYAQFDGEDIGSRRYKLGEEIDRSEVHPAVITVLEQQGRISGNRPSEAAIPIEERRAVEDMSRPELEAEAASAFRSRVAEMTEDDLRHAVERHRQDEQDRAQESAQDDDTGGDDYDAVKDKPLASLKTADLNLIAEREEVSLDGANTNADRVKAIETARAGK